ncbi:MAG: aminotransferase class IV [Pirellula sp.]
MDPAFLNSIGLRWDSQAERFDESTLQAMSWSVIDYGSLYGAFLVERIRTFGGKLPGGVFSSLERHVHRLSRGLELLHIDLPSVLPQLRDTMERLIELNRELVAHEGDVSLVVVVSPGSMERSGDRVQCMFHLLPLSWRRIRIWLTQGADLVPTQIASGAGECLPGSIKSRSRLNYFLADLEALEHGDASLGLLRTSAGFVSDTSVANLLVVASSGEIVSPPKEKIVVGTSLEVVEMWLRERGDAIVFRDVAFEELNSAAEVLLLGNSACVWHAASMRGESIGTGECGPLGRWLQKRWVDEVGFDWVGEARQTR